MDPMKVGCGRRRFLQIAAGAGVAAFAHSARAERAQPVVWSGVAFGAPSRISLYGADLRRAGQVLRTCIALIRRLEASLSLFRPDSAIVELNRAGHVRHAPSELVELLRLALRLSRRTEGAFDVTVQPLFELYAHHFAPGRRTPAPPAQEELTRTLSLVDYTAVEVDDSSIRFRRPRMAVTLNGIAQGYLADRMTAVLKAHGFDHVLLDLGEMRAIGAHPDGRAWRLGIRDPFAHEPFIAEIDLRDQALATSAPYGTVFDADGRYHHLFDPATGRPSARYASVSVRAADATTADALSTAFFSLSLERITHLLGTRFLDADALVVTGDGRRLRLPG